MSARTATTTSGSRRAGHHGGDHHEHRAPKRVKPRNLADYLDVMARAMFQAGISWRVVDAKWPGMTEAFHSFDPKRVAAIKPAEMSRLMGDTRIIRNRRKIEGLIDNAHTLLALDAEPGGFAGYLRSFSDYESLADDLVRRFKWLGETGVYYFLWVVGEPVPEYEDWQRTHAGRGPKRGSGRPARSR